MLSSFRRSATVLRSRISAKLSSAAASTPSSYSTGVQILHWTNGGAMAGCVATVLLAQNTKDKAEKGKYMFLHKSLGLLAFALLTPRIFFRVTSQTPAAIAGAHAVEHLLAKISHGIMYAFIIFMPVSGVAMGYFGGNGLPFFFTTIPGATAKKPEIAKPAYEWHKKAGVIFEYLVPLHIAGALGHYARGHTIFSRILGSPK
jgi:cytochrome b561